MTKKEAVFTEDLQNKKINVTRSFDASLEQVWKAWTESELLDQWWAPEPYKAETKTMDFREGGSWLYCMKGPEGDRQWCKEEFKTIDHHKRITNDDSFCDENGNLNSDFPIMSWRKEFDKTDDDTIVKIEISFSKEGDMEKILKMGFREGFTAGLDNLDRYLNTHS